jgi:predicted esterase
MPYRLYVAQGYNSPGNATRKYPLIVWLHGAGEKGTNNTSQMNNGVVNLANDTNQAYDPAFVMVPQLPGSPGSTGAWFGGDTRGDTIISERRFLLAIEDMCQQYRIDRDRIYVMGLSLGGAGSWEISMMYPDIFAAAAPMSLGGSPNSINRTLLVPMPIWSFCGSTDGTYKPANDSSVADVRNAGGRVIYTIYTGEGHSSDVWGTAAGNFEFYKWLMAQRRHQPPAGLPNIRALEPTPTQSLTTGSTSLVVSGTAELATPTLPEFQSIQYSLNGAGYSSATGTSWWTTPSISLSPGANFLRFLATATTAPSAAVPLGGITTFSDALIVNDTTPPVLEVLNPTTGHTYISPTDFLDIRGHASDNRHVTRITWTKSRGGSGRAGAQPDIEVPGKVAWKASKIPLKSGHNIITITAYDLAGNSDSHTITVFRSPSRGGDYFSQDFNNVPNVAALVDTTQNPGANTFYNIAARAQGGTWDINDGKLRIIRPGGGASGSREAGFVRRYTMEGPPSKVIAVSFDLSISGSPNTWTSIAKLGLGLYVNNSDGSGGTGYSAINTELDIFDGGSSTFRFRVADTSGTTSFPSNGATHHVTWLVNSSGTTQPYLAPDGSTQTVGHNKSDLWVGTTQVLDEATKNGSFGSGELSHFRFIMEGGEAVTLTLDNLKFSDFRTSSPYGSWLETHFDSDALVNPAISGDDADPDRDGVTNLAEYGLGTDPLSASSANLPQVTNVSDHLRIQFDRIEPADVTYVVEASDDLTNWTAIATRPAGESSWTGPATVEESGAGNTRTVKVTDTVPFTSETHRFLRVKVERPE